MKGIQKYRLGVQALCLVLTAIGFFTDFKFTMLVIMGLTLVGGVFYCGWVCPYGFIQDVASKLGNVLGIKKRKMPKNIQRILKFSRYIVLVLVMLIGTDFVFSIMSFDPRGNFGNLLSGNAIAISAFVVLVFFLMVSLFFERPFCNYLCYEGAKYGLMGSLKLFTIKRNKATCVGCKKCDKACPMNIEVSECSNLRSTQCINCFQCVSSCPVKDTLNYGKANMDKKEKKKYFTAVAGVLVVISALIAYNIFSGSNLLARGEHSEVANGSKAEVKVENNNTLPEVKENTDSVDNTENSPVSTDNMGETAGLKDGVYTGQGEGYRGMMTVEVKVDDGKIVSVEVIDHRDDLKWFNRANDIIPDSIVEAQRADVDLVGGATYSSMGITEGVKNALEKAK